MLGRWNYAIELGIMVPEDQVEGATAILEDYLKARQVLTSEIEVEDEEEFIKKIAEQG